ncbi:MAG: hypothetical protein HY902_15830 [Deltaproteobacteria bacterium]|nr:hypothetical protein [Deltaproteobacteria bacterium]
MATAAMGCTSPAPSDPADAKVDANTKTCTVLFGQPNDKTGLTADQCQPHCDCVDLAFAPPTYTDADAEALLAWTLDTPYPPVAEDPYAHPEQHVPDHGKICAVLANPGSTKTYRLQTFASRAEAEAAGGRVTHGDACGVCSPLHDLAVYMRQRDLTDPVRQCALQPDQTGAMACLQKLGFDLPCAQIWYFNSQHTRKKCLATCLALLKAPYHNPDGTLNDCLLCDEKESGDVFKAVAGRTRRNTGLPSSMCRPCGEVVPVVHQYP